MAKLFPDSKRTRVVFPSRAEEIFYEECRRSLGGSWRVYHSVTLSAIESGELKDNEIDFVLYHPKFGAICVEVKGGRIGFDQSQQSFFTINRNNQKFTIKNPFLQALNWKSRFLRQLKERNIRIPVTQAICFPNVRVEEFPRAAGLEPDLILGRDELLNLEEILKKLVRKVQLEKYLNFEDRAKDLDDLLIGSDFSTRFYFREYVDAHEARVRDIETIHEGLITPVTSAKELGIEGEAGTGKTILAARLAKHFRDQGQKVLMLTSNELLSSHLKSVVGPDVVMSNYIKLGRDFHVDLLRSANEFKGSRDEWIHREAPAQLLKNIEASPERYDVIICDEAQDVQPTWWPVIRKLARNDHTRFYVFFDRSQGIFGSVGHQFVPEDILPVKPPYFPLVHNYRTTREIATFARMFRTGSQILASHTDRLGYLPRIIYYRDSADAKRKLDELVRTLIETEQLRPNELALLSARRPLQKPSIIAGEKKIAGLDLYHLQPRANASLFRDQGLAISTIGSFKGLETKIGILINFSEYNMPLSNPLMASLFYVAASRAKHMLYVFLKDDDKKRYNIDLAIKNIGLTGSVVIDQSDDGTDLLGEVIHYNPQRVGWLRVDDPKYAKSNIMFFPSDLKAAGIRDLKLGDRLQFRPRAEGPSTIASDLSLWTDTPAKK